MCCRLYIRCIFTLSYKNLPFNFIHPITDRSYSDIQQVPRRHYNNNSPSPRRRPFMGTPTRV